MTRAIWIAVIMAIVALAPIIGADSQTITKVEPQASFAEVGETFTINIVVLDVQNLYGLEARLLWNSSNLRIAEVDIRLGVSTHADGVLHEISGTAPIQIYQNETSQTLGKYVLAASSMAPASSFNGSGNIARITFNVTKSGTCTLDLQTKLYDKPSPGDVSEQITHITQNGIFGEHVDWTAWLYIIVIAVILAVTIIAILYIRSFNMRKRT